MKELHTFYFNYYLQTLLYLQTDKPPERVSFLFAAFLFIFRLVFSKKSALSSFLIHDRPKTDLLATDIAYYANGCILHRSNLFFSNIH